MDLVYAHQLMVAADQQGDRSYQVTGQRGCKEAQRLAAAGLVEISIQEGDGEPTVLIERLTSLGRTFLQNFADSPPLPLTLDDGPPEESLNSAAATIEKWRIKFAAMRMNERR